MTRTATQQCNHNSCSSGHRSGSRSGGNASSHKSASAAPAWGGKKAAPASVQKGFEQGLPTPGKTPEVPSSMKAGGGKGGSGGRKPRRPIEGGAATGATAASGQRYVAPGSRTKPPAKGKDQSAKPEEVTELNFGAPLFQALARFLTISNRWRSWRRCSWKACSTQPQRRFCGKWRSGSTELPGDSPHPSLRRTPEGEVPLR